MASSQNEWTINIAEAIKSANRNLERIKNKRDYDEQFKEVHFPHGSDVICYDITCPIWSKEGTKVTTTTVYHKPRSSEDKMKELERKKMMEDFKYNVAKNCNSIEKKLNKALESNNDELIRVHNRIDLVNRKLAEVNNNDIDDIKYYIEKRLGEIDQKNLSTIEELEIQNAKLQSQVDNLK